MQHWLVTVNARQAGAIGIFYRVAFAVEAADLDGARNAAIEKAISAGYETRGTEEVRAL